VATLEWVLGTTTKVQLLRALLPLCAPVTGREVQRLAGVRSTAGVRRALEELTSAGILVRSGSSTTHQYQINRDHYLIAQLEALFEVERGQMGRLADAVEAALAAAGVRGAVRSVVVFGSQARGDARPDSDLDLLLITSDAERVDEVEAAVLGAAGSMAAHLGLRVSPIVLAAERAAGRTRDGDLLMQNILAEGRTLLGESLAEVTGAW
jgi:UTP:GlnB (protein PII) uridylyltransferase